MAEEEQSVPAGDDVSPGSPDQSQAEHEEALRQYRG